MTIHERDRYQLHHALETHLGPENAATLMAHLPPVGWADVATKHDLHALEERLELRIHGEAASLRTEIAGLRTELHGEIADLRTELHGEIADLRSELRTETASLRTGLADVRGELRTELQRGLRTTTIVTVMANTAVVGTIATLANLF